MNKNRISEPTMKFFVYFISTEISLKQLLQIKRDNLDDEMSFIHLNA